MTFSDDLRRKANDADLPEKAKGLGDALADLIKAALTMVGSFTAENRERVDGALDRAQEKVEENVSGRSVDKVTRVRASVDKGLDKLTDQGEKLARRSGATPPDEPRVRPDGQWPRTPVPDDVHSAFDDEPGSAPPPDHPSSLN